jgi:predicted nuclease with TOPRIM domain
MDTHIESVTDQIPSAVEPESFGSALEAAFASLDAASSFGDDTPPAKDEPKAAPVAESVQPDAVEDDLLEQLSEEGDWTPKAANRFKQLKEEMKQFREERDQFKQLTVEQELKLKEMSGLVENKDVEALQQRIAEYEHAQMFSNLERTSAYQEAVTKPLEVLIEQADQIASKYEVDTDALIDIFAMTDADLQDERLSEILGHASERDKARVYKLIEEVNPILARRAELYSNVEEASREAEMLEEARNNAQLAERAKLRENITRNVMDRITEKLPFLKTFDKLDVGAIQQKAAQTDPSVIHPVDFAYNAVSAQLLPAIVREYVSQKKEIEALTDRLASFEDAEPRISGTGSSRLPTASGSRSTAGSDVNFIDAINRAFGG